MRIIIDENLPIAFLSNLLSEFDVISVKDAQWAGIKNGELIKKVEGNYDVFITADKNLRYQQNITKRTFAIVELYTNRRPFLREIDLKILDTIRSISDYGYYIIQP